MKLNHKNRVSTPFGDFQIDVENLVDQLFGEGTPECCDKTDECSGTAWTPRISVVESETNYWSRKPRIRSRLEAVIRNQLVSNRKLLGRNLKLAPDSNRKQALLE